MEGVGAVTGLPTTLWPQDFPELKLIDDALRCNICYDYIKTCMVTPCAHSYCSKCIRTSLLYKTACPSCFEETFDNNLRNNRVLDRVVELFVSVKDKLLKHLQIAAVHFNCNDHLKYPSPSQNSIDQKRSILEATPKSTNQKSKSSSTKGKLNFTLTSNNSCVDLNKSNISKRLENILGSPSTNSDLECSDLPIKDNEFPTIPPMFLQPKTETVTKVEVRAFECPVCGVNIPERNINVHLDTCLANVDKPPVKSPIKTKQKRSPLKKMVWSLMSEKDLRKKLKDYGLNTQGDKKALISRIQRYVLLYNSECDCDNPRPISEIIRLTEKEEKQLPMQNQQQRLIISKKTDPKVIEEENKKYLENNKDSFKKLIAAMKSNEGKNIKPVSLNRAKIISTDDEDDLPNTLGKKAETSTTTELVESIFLSDSNDDFPTSPVLGETIVDSNKTFLAPECCSDSFFILDSPSKSDKYSSKVNEVPENNFNDFLAERKTCLKKPSSNSKSHLTRHCKSPEKVPSSSCIITEHSDDESNDSLSLLINHNIDDVDNITEADTANILNSNSQVNDPDFFVDTEDLFETNSDEVFQPRRKSKRKHPSPVPVVINPNVTPRRTRRRLNYYRSISISLRSSSDWENKLENNKHINITCVC